MTRAIELAPDRATAAELYAELSFETRDAGRHVARGGPTGSWSTAGSIALELAEPETRARARALIARCVWAPLGSADAAREAGALAERLGDPDLRSYAWDARAITLWVSGEHDLGRALEERRFELLDQINDPDHIADIHYAPVTGCIWLGYFDEARRLARPPRRDHERPDAAPPDPRRRRARRGRGARRGWESIQALQPRAEETILGNLETPCVRSPRSLLVCALAAAQARRSRPRGAARGRGRGVPDGGVRPRARHAAVAARAASAATSTWPSRLSPTRCPDRGWHRAWLLLSTHSARLDALARLGQRDELETWTRRAPARISSRSTSARSASCARTSNWSSARSPPSKRCA